MSYLKGVVGGHMLGSLTGLTQVDTRSLDYSSYGASEKRSLGFKA